MSRKPCVYIIFVVMFKWGAKKLQNSSLPGPEILGSLKTTRASDRSTNRQLHEKENFKCRLFQRLFSRCYAGVTPHLTTFLPVLLSNNVPFTGCALDERETVMMKTTKGTSKRVDESAIVFPPACNYHVVVTWLDYWLLEADVTLIIIFPLLIAVDIH